MASACCFRDNDCLDLPFDECVENGGLPFPEGDACIGGDAPQNQQIIRCTHQACCYPQGSSDRLCFDLPPNDCETSFAGQAMGRGTRCVEIESVPGGCNPQNFQMPIRCCLIDGTAIAEMHPDHCSATYPSHAQVSVGGDCPPSPREEDCRFPEPDRVVGRTWTMELCANAPMGPAIVGSGVPNHRQGYAALLTTREVRSTGRDRCEHAVTTMYMGPDGYADPVFCSTQDRFDGPRAHHGGMVIMANVEGAPTRPGYGLIAAGFAAPDWTEATASSQLVRCQSPYR